MLVFPYMNFGQQVLVYKTNKYINVEFKFSDLLVSLKNDILYIS